MCVFIELNFVEKMKLTAIVQKYATSEVFVKAENVGQGVNRCI